MDLLHYQIIFWNPDRFPARKGQLEMISRVIKGAVFRLVPVTGNGRKSCLGNFWTRLG